MINDKLTQVEASTADETIARCGFSVRVPADAYAERLAETVEVLAPK